jgi:hypothetical protein
VIIFVDDIGGEVRIPLFASCNTAAAVVVIFVVAVATL